LTSGTATHKVPRFAKIRASRDGVSLVATEGAEYRVKLPIFEGPFDLLLHLVKINEMEITDISLAKLTAQYLEHLEMMQEMDLDLAGEFLVVAATLLQIKARYLLPGELDDEIEEEEIDEVLGARELMQQLIEYRSYKEIVAKLRELEQDSAGVYYRHRAPVPVDADPDEDAVSSDIQLLFAAMANVLRYIEKRDPHTDLFEHYKVEDKVEYIEAALAEVGEMNVTREFERCLNKIEVIVTFLALLELIRLRRVRVVQPGAEREILIYSMGEPTSEASDAPSDAGDDDRTQEAPAEAPADADSAPVEEPDNQ
jgi:segregation and condensation protein A